MFDQKCSSRDQEKSFPRNKNDHLDTARYRQPHVSVEYADVVQAEREISFQLHLMWGCQPPKSPDFILRFLNAIRKAQHEHASWNVEELSEAEEHAVINVDKQKPTNNFTSLQKVMNFSVNRVQTHTNFHIWQKNPRELLGSPSKM